MPMKLMPAHSCGESRLKCADCQAQICPKCCVECPVGNRCRNCSKGSTVKRKTISFDSKKAVGFLSFGGLYGWMLDYATGSSLSFCFYLAMWAAGRETGSQWRRGNKELGLSWAMPFVIGMGLGATALFLCTAEEVLVPMLINLGVMVLGLDMGKCGFG